MKLLAPASVLLAACSADVPERPTYDEHVASILTANCVRCHGAPTAISEGRNCVRVDAWERSPDPADLCNEDQPTTAPLDQRADVILGVRDAGAMIVRSVLDGTMPKGDVSLSSRQIEILQRWMDAGFPRRASNAPAAIELVTPPASGAVVDQRYDVKYIVSDPDGDSVTWSLGWKGSTKSGTFASGLREGAGTVSIDTSTLASGTYELVAELDDGTTQVAVTAAGALTVPAGRNAVPTVTVLSPNGGESFYPSQTVTVTWRGDDDGAQLRCDVVAVGAGTTVPIASGVVLAPGAQGTASWILASAAPASDYRIRVTVLDDGTPALGATDTSDAAFAVSPPPQQVSFSSQIQPIFTASCLGNACHDSVMPADGLPLTAGSSYAALVGVNSTQCTSVKLVAPGAPDQSYLVWKLQGSGPCFFGSRMPKSASLPASQIQLVRDWIANGAPNN
jgi:hypothetical protein